jgi:hypothetical protein
VAVPGTNQILAADNDLESIKYGVFDAATLTPMVTDVAVSDPKTQESETDLISGPKGVFMTNCQFVPNNEHVLLRRYDPASRTFGPAHAIEGSDPIDNSAINPDAYEDASGSIHVVCCSNFDRGRLRYLRSGAPTAPGRFASWRSIRPSREASSPSARPRAPSRARRSPWRHRRAACCAARPSR